MWELLAPIIGAAANGIFGGDSDASTTTTRLPAAMTPEQERIFTQFMNYLMGYTPYVGEKPRLADYIVTTAPSTSSGMGGGEGAGRGEMGYQGPPSYTYDMDRYNTDLAAWEQAQTGVEPIPSMEERISQDTEATAAADRAFIESQTGINTDLMNALTGNFGNYQESIAPIIAANQRTMAPMTLQFGNFQTPFTTGTARRSQDLLSQLAGTTKGFGDALAERGFSLDSAIAQLENTYGTTHTPNEAFMNYWQNILNPLVQANENRRYGLSTDTTTGNYTPSIFDQLSGGLNLGTSITDMLKGLTSTETTTPTYTLEDVLNNMDWSWWNK